MKTTCVKSSHYSQTNCFGNLKLQNSFAFATDAQEWRNKKLRFSFSSREIVKSAAHKKNTSLNLNFMNLFSAKSVCKKNSIRNAHFFSSQPKLPLLCVYICRFTGEKKEKKSFQCRAIPMECLSCCLSN